MESTLTEPEIDAVLQLIQLSNGSANGNFDVLFLKFLGKEKEKSELISQSDCTHEESVGEAQSSSSIIIANSQKFEKADDEDEDKDDDDDQILPRSFSKLSSVADVYRKTAPSLGEVDKGNSNHGKKKRKNPN